MLLLGDSRGMFYDNRVPGNLGIDDYALIKDFVSGSDKLQVRAGTYWDRNARAQAGLNREFDQKAENFYSTSDRLRICGKLRKASPQGSAPQRTKTTEDVNLHRSVLPLPRQMRIF